MPHVTCRNLSLIIAAVVLCQAGVVVANSDYPRFVQSYAASNTASATNSSTSPLFNLGTFRAGTTVRVGTCNASSDLPNASFNGDTFLRLLDSGGRELSFSDDESSCGLGSYVTYTVPYSMTLQVRAGCFGSLSCSGFIYVNADMDSTGSLSDVVGSFNDLASWGLTSQSWYYTDADIPSSYTNSLFNFDTHFQGVQRIRTWTPNGYDAHWFAFTGSGNADLFLVSMTPWWLGPWANLAQFTGGADAFHSAARSWQSFPQSVAGGTAVHVGGFQSYGRYMAVGLERADRSHILFLDTEPLDLISHPSVRLMYTFMDREVGDSRQLGPAAAVAVNKVPGADRPFVMAVAGANSQVIDFYRSPVNAQGYANPASNSWIFECRIPAPGNPAPFEDYFQHIALVPQDDGTLFLVGTRSNGTSPQGSGNRARLYRLDRTGSCYNVVSLAVGWFGDYNGTGAGFNGAAGVHVDAESNRMLIYSMHSFRPDASPGTTPFVEFRP
jgi:hypothetical protein